MFSKFILKKGPKMVILFLETIYLNPESYLNPITPAVHKIVKHKLKLLQHLVQDFQHVPDPEVAIHRCS